jgi:diguanylate cyclase (GGDEF)-like protein
VDLIWEKVGPRHEERALAGRVAGVLWLLVPPMLFVGLLLPGTERDHWPVIAAITVPAAIWGLLCLFIPWERVKTPLLFHVPATLALPYIAVLVALTGMERSPFTLTLLMLISFCAYFFPLRIVIAYVAGCVLVEALPLLYDTAAREGSLPAEVWVAGFVYPAVGGVLIVGKRQLLALRDAAHELSLRDSLTSLANRRALTELLTSDSGGSRRSDSLGLLLIDLDDFKEANTLHGLLGGDKVLCKVAETLRAVARGDDTVVRLGGDEFAIVTRDITRHGMQRIAERVIETIREAGMDLDLPGFHLSASAGWALYPEHADSVDELMTTADLSLRAAKMRGKNCAQEPVNWVEEAASPQPG